MRHADPHASRVAYRGKPQPPPKSLEGWSDDSSESTLTSSSTSTETESTLSPRSGFASNFSGVSPRPLAPRTGKGPRRGWRSNPSSPRGSERHRSVGRSSRYTTTSFARSQTTTCRAPSPGGDRFRPVITRLAQRRGNERASSRTRSEMGDTSGQGWESWLYYDAMTRRAETRRAALRGEGDLTREQQKELEDIVECTFAPKVNSAAGKHCTTVQPSRTQQEACEELYKISLAKTRRAEQAHQVRASAGAWRVQGDPCDVDVTTVAGKEWQRQWRQNFRPDLGAIHRGRTPHSRPITKVENDEEETEER
eukprot:Hpha_TRINITY_DN16385_c0_g2::TRINITY_DN16385_c0_g2_i1::g.58183::m.58183